MPRSNPLNLKEGDYVLLRRIGDDSRVPKFLDGKWLPFLEYKIPDEIYIGAPTRRWHDDWLKYWLGRRRPVLLENIAAVMRAEEVEKQRGLNGLMSPEQARESRMPLR